MVRKLRLRPVKVVRQACSEKEALSSILHLHLPDPKRVLLLVSHNAQLQLECQGKWQYVLLQTNTKATIKESSSHWNASQSAS